MKSKPEVEAHPVENAPGSEEQKPSFIVAAIVITLMILSFFLALSLIPLP